MVRVVYIQFFCIWISNFYNETPNICSLILATFTLYVLAFICLETNAEALVSIDQQAFPFIC